MNEFATAQLAMLGWTEIVLILATLGVLALVFALVLITAALAIRHWSRPKSPQYPAPPPVSKS